MFTGADYRNQSSDMRYLEIMDAFEVVKGRFGFDSKRFATCLVVFFIALTVSVMVLMMHRNSSFEGFAKAKVLGGNAQNFTELGVDSKDDSSRQPSIPNDEQLNRTLSPGFSKEPGSRDDSSQPTSMANDSISNSYQPISKPQPDKKLNNGLLIPSFGDGSSSKNDSSQPTSMPDDKLLNGPSAPGFGKGSSSRNNSSQPTSMSDDKLLNGPSAPGFGKGSSSRNNSSQPIRIPNDKLLGGLLAPGFDEKSCLSRHQSFLYHKSSPYKPSPHLLSKLRKYEALHKHCGPYTKYYGRALKKLKSSHIGSTGGCKYLVWFGANGMGNRIVSMASAFLYALLTNRVLLVDHGTDMAHLFCEPFPNTSWLLPKDFHLKKQLGRLKLTRAHSYESIVKNNMINSSKESPQSFVYLTIPLGDYDLNQLFLCNESQALAKNVPWLLLLSDQYFAPTFFLIPSFKQEMSKLFPEKESVFHHLGRYLFHPSNQAWELITKFYQTNLAKTDERIGLQVRVFHGRATPFQMVMDQILSCMLEQKLLPKVDTRKSVHSPSRNKISKVVLITSLYPDFYKNMSGMYWKKPTVTGEFIGVYQPSHEEYQRHGDNMHNMKAWAEIYLLSLCDVLVTSAWSTFGYVAQGLGGLKSWILLKHGNFPNPPCQQDISMEPCFHYAPTYDCKAKTKIDVGSVVPYVRHCVDRKSGVKLVNDHEL